MHRIPISLNIFWFLLVYALLIVLFIWDHTSHGHAGSSAAHVAIEFLILVSAMVGVVFFWRQWTESRRLTTQLRKKLDDAREEVSRWQQEERQLVSDLRSAIDHKFDEWEFNASEKEIAWCLLKGMSMKDIAQSRGSTDRSVRQQAYVLYHKAGLAGRAELSAHFLGGVMDAGEPD